MRFLAWPFPSAKSSSLCVVTIVVIKLQPEYYCLSRLVVGKQYGSISESRKQQEKICALSKIIEYKEDEQDDSYTHREAVLLKETQLLDYPSNFLQYSVTYVYS